MGQDKRKVPHWLSYRDRLLPKCPVPLSGVFAESLQQFTELDWMAFQKLPICKSMHALNMTLGKMGVVSMDEAVASYRSALEETWAVASFVKTGCRIIQPSRVLVEQLMETNGAYATTRVLVWKILVGFALVLSFMPTGAAAQILTKLPPDLRAEVAGRIASMEQTPPEVIQRVEQVLEKKVSSVLSSDLRKAGGPKALVDLLNRVDRSTERLIMEMLSETNPDLADRIKNMMFVFEDIVQLDDRAVQQILKEVDMKELATALKGVGPEVEEKVFKNMSERAVAMLKEDMEFMGPVRVRVVEEAQQKIVGAIRRLEEAGEITIGRSGEEEMVV